MSRSHRPVAFEVSGGLDSSALFAVAETLRRGAGLPAPGIAAYTWILWATATLTKSSMRAVLGNHLRAPFGSRRRPDRPLQWYRERARMSGEFPGYPNGTMSLHLRNRARADGAVSL